MATPTAPSKLGAAPLCGRRPGLRRLVGTVAVIGLFAVAGCSSSDDGSAAPADDGASASDDAGATTNGSTATTALPEPAEYTVAFEEPGADEVNLLLEESDDLLAERQVEILDVQGGADDTELILAFELESHRCYGIRTEIVESGTEVVITLIGGQLIDVNPASCTYGTYPYTASVTLDDVLGGRAIVPAEPTEPELATAVPWRPPPTAADPDDEGTAGDTGQTGGDGGDGEAGDEAPAADGAEADGDPRNADHLLGWFIEDGVEWAIDNDIEWRLLTVDGDAVGARMLEDPDRISFVVEADRIVAYEWS